MDGKSWRENGLRLRRKPNREVEASSRRVLFCAPEPARRPLSADNRARLHRIALAIEANGGDLKMDYTAVRRDCPRRLMSSSAGVADALADLSGRGASGRPVSFTRFPCMFRARTERRPQRAPQGFKPRYAVVQPESPSPHRRWAVPGARGRACACIPPVVPAASSSSRKSEIRVVFPEGRRRGRTRRPGGRQGIARAGHAHIARRGRPLPDHRRVVRRQALSA